MVYRFLYFLFLAIDACFRLKRRLVSSEKKDPGLGTGLASFVEDAGFRKYVLTVTDQKEMSSCTGLSALDHANSKFSAGYATTGAGICCCARHELIERGGVVDLQKGERSVFSSHIPHCKKTERSKLIDTQIWTTCLHRYSSTMTMNFTRLYHTILPASGGLISLNGSTSFRHKSDLRLLCP